MTMDSASAHSCILETGYRRRWFKCYEEKMNMSDKEVYIEEEILFF